MSTEHGNNRLISVHAPFLVLAIAPNQKSLSNVAINGVGRNSCVARATAICIIISCKVSEVIQRSRRNKK